MNTHDSISPSSGAPDKALLVKELEQRGGEMSKDELLELLERWGWNEDRLDVTKRLLVESGMAVPVRGRRGGLRRIAQSEPPAPNEEQLERAKRQELEESERLGEAVERQERELYPHVERWARDVAGYGIVATVADQRPTSRKTWENPDLLLLDVIPLAWSLTPQLDVTVIEVKIPLSPQAVWQAAHYRTFAHYVYLACFESSDAMRKEIHEGRLYQLAVDLGLGLISLRPAGAGAKGVRADEIHSPVRQSPEPKEVDRLLTDYEAQIRKVDFGDDFRAPGQIVAGHLAQLGTPRR